MVVMIMGSARVAMVVMEGLGEVAIATMTEMVPAASYPAATSNTTVVPRYSCAESAPRSLAAPGSI
jgi:hypothetical protein